MSEAVLALLSEPIVMLAVGVCASFAAAASQASREQGRIVWPLEFLRQRPYRVFNAVLASLVAFVLLAAAGEATPGAAFGAGYAGSDILQRLADAARNRVPRA